MMTTKNSTPSLILAAMVSAAALLTGTGCAVVRDQQSVGSYIDDATLTTRVKAKFADDPTVSAMSISVETLKGVVQLSGFAKSSEERVRAGQLALGVSGVQSVRNDIIVRG
jgi:hyperosmotically inducible protein